MAKNDYPNHVFSVGDLVVTRNTRKGNIGDEWAIGRGPHEVLGVRPSTSSAAGHPQFVHLKGHSHDGVSGYWLAPYKEPKK